MKTIDIKSNAIDKILGPGDERFFSNGFRKVIQSINDITVYPYNKGEVDKGIITAKATLHYPNDWSKKKENSELIPHLSSVDAVILSTQLNEMYLTYKYSLNEEQRQSLWLKSFNMKASSTPQEDLQDFSIESVQLNASKYKGTNQFISVFEAKIGTITIISEIVHDINDMQLDQGVYDTSVDLLGPSATRYYGEGYKKPKQIIQDIDIQLKDQRISSPIKIEYPQEIYMKEEGFEGKYRPSISMIDCMLIIAQLGQVLLYSLDNVKREDSNTLWMRKVFMESDNPYQQFKTFEALTYIQKNRLLSVNNSHWRSCDMIGYCQGIRVEYSIAHELPASYSNIEQD